jgi:uncharacterized protein (DUF58 family)
MNSQTMRDSKKFLHPETVKRIARLDLRARHVVEGFLSGMHRSRYLGQSVEFRQHRQYTRGDDLRYVDWKVWGKQDRYYVKQFEEDTNLRCMLLCDVSGSMRYGCGAMNKYDYGCTIAVSLAYLLLQQQDAVGCVAFDESIRATAPMRTKRNHLDSIIRTLDLNEPGGESRPVGEEGDAAGGRRTMPRSATGVSETTDVYQVLRNVAESYPRRGLIVLVSDLLVDRPGLFRGLRLLRSRGHDILVFHVLDDDELDFSFNGSTRFEGLESTDHLRCNPRALREGYLTALHIYLDEIRRGCSGHNVDYALLRTSQPLDAALTAYLSNRLGMHHRNAE